MKERLGIIDVGTNSTLLLIVQRCSENTLLPLFQASEITRIGRGIFQSGTIERENLYKTIGAINRFKALALKKGVQQLIAVGTAPFRIAENSAAAVELIIDECGVTIEVLPPEEEATLSFRGAVYGRYFSGTACVLDIGGGSTEVVTGDTVSAGWQKSLPLGAVQTAESAALPQSPEPVHRKGLLKQIKKQIPSSVRKRIKTADLLIATGGTATTLAWLESGDAVYNGSKVDGIKFSLEDLNSKIDWLSTLSLAQRRRTLQHNPERADIIIPGSLILKSFVEVSGMDSFIVSDRGLRFGLALRALSNSIR